MSIIAIVVLLVFMGVALYVVNTLIPMDAKFKTIINIVVVLAVLVWLLQSFGLLGTIGANPRIH